MIMGKSKDFADFIIGIGVVIVGGVIVNEIIKEEEKLQASAILADQIQQEKNRKKEKPVIYESVRSYSSSEMKDSCPVCGGTEFCSCGACNHCFGGGGGGSCNSCDSDD